MTVQRHVLWLERQRAAAGELPYRVEHPTAGPDLLRENDELLVAAIGRTVGKPLAVAQQLSAADDNAEVVIVCDELRLDTMRESLRMTPFVGEHTRVVAADDKLHDEIATAVSKAKKKRDFVRVAARAQSVLDTDRPASRRPTTRQYATAMWSASPVGALAVIPTTRHIVNANPAVTELLELPEVELIGASLDSIFDTDADEWDWLGLEHTAEAGQIMTYPHSGGEEVHLELRAAPVGQVWQDVVLLFLWDITERVRFERLQAEYLASEQHARERAERASEIRENVLATVAHDLRSPLTTLMTAGHLLEEIGADNSDPTVGEVAGSIRRSSQYMANLVDDLVDIAHIEGGRLELDVEQVAVHKIVDQTLEITRGRAREADVQLESQVDPNLSVTGDETRLVQMLENLVSNAIKFSPAHQRVTVTAREHGDAVRLKVTDRGPGIPPEQLPRLFEYFWQRDDKSDHGLGLGLAIVNGIVEAHDGEISVDSTPDEQTTFCVDLPTGDT